MENLLQETEKALYIVSLCSFCSACDLKTVPVPSSDVFSRFA